jgi:hypothetical protein
LEEAKSVLEVIEGQPVPSERPGRLRRLQAFADKAKEDEVTTEEFLEAKEALLARGLEEGKVCYSLIFGYLNFCEHLHVCCYAYFGIFQFSMVLAYLCRVEHRSLQLTHYLAMGFAGIA